MLFKNSSHLILPNLSGWVEVAETEQNHFSGFQSTANKERSSLLLDVSFSIVDCGKPLK
jgi:hypothetical protein